MARRPADALVGMAVVQRGGQGKAREPRAARGDRMLIVSAGTTVAAPNNNKVDGNIGESDEDLTAVLVDELGWSGRCRGRRSEEGH